MYYAICRCIASNHRRGTSDGGTPAHRDIPYAASLNHLRRFEESKSVLRKMMPVARRVLGESHELTLRMRWMYAAALCNDPDAPLDDLVRDLGEAVTTFEEIERTARCVLGGAHPTTMGLEEALRMAQDALSRYT